MKKIFTRLILLIAALAAAAGGTALLRHLRPVPDTAALTRLGEAAPLLALAADTPQLRAVVCGDARLMAALEEVFCVAGCDAYPGRQTRYDLGVIAAAPAFQTDRGRRSLLRVMAERTLQQSGVLVIPAEWAALADFSCRRTPVAGTGGAYLFLAPENKNAPTLPELSGRLTKLQRAAGFEEYPAAILDAYYGMDEPPCPIPAPQPPPELSGRVCQISIALLLFLALFHLVLSGRSLKGGARCCAVENGMAAALAAVGTFTAAATFQAEWGIDPVCLTLLAAALCLYPAGPRRGERSVALFAAAVLAVTILLLNRYGAAPWCGLLLCCAAALWLWSAGWSITRPTLPFALAGLAAGIVTGIFLYHGGADSRLILTAALVLRGGFLLKL